MLLEPAMDSLTGLYSSAYPVYHGHIYFFSCLYRWISGTVAWIYILLLPFTACVPPLATLNDLLLKVIQFPAQVGVYIRDGSSGILEEYQQIP